MKMVVTQVAPPVLWVIHTIDIIHLDRDWKRDHVSNIWQYKMIDPILVAV